jgi:signal transduction histidine kinase
MTHVLLLGVEPPVKKFLRQHIVAVNSSKVCFDSPPLEGTAAPKQGRWDVIFIDRKARSSNAAAALKADKIQGLKIVLTEPENLHSAIEFWGTGVYSYFLKPINPALFQLVWQNARERIQLGRRLSRLQKKNPQKRGRAGIDGAEILEDLLRSHLKMQELEQERTKFLAETAHELGTPLTALQGYLTLLAKQDSGALNATQQELLTCCLQSVRRLLRLSYSLMDLNLPVGGRNLLQLEEGSIQKCLQRAAQELRPAAEAKKLRMSVEAAPEVPPLRFDFDRMQQVFVNLLDNAIKFTPAEGSVRVQCGPYFWDRRSMQEILYTTQDRRKGKNGMGCNSVRVVVEDNGRGIAPEYLQDIFREYRRGNSNGSSRGFGLGLSVARQIVEAHDGKVWAESEANSGSRFTVLIPTSL